MTKLSPKSELHKYILIFRGRYCIEARIDSVSKAYVDELKNVEPTDEQIDDGFELKHVLYEKVLDENCADELYIYGIAEHGLVQVFKRPGKDLPSLLDNLGKPIFEDDGIEELKVRTLTPKPKPNSYIVGCICNQDGIVGHIELNISSIFDPKKLTLIKTSGAAFDTDTAITGIEYLDGKNKISAQIDGSDYADLDPKVHLFFCTKYDSTGKPKALFLDKWLDGKAPKKPLENKAVKKNESEMSKEDILGRLKKSTRDFPITKIKEEFRDDGDVMLAAVKSMDDGTYNLKYASKRLLNNKEFALKIADLAQQDSLRYFSDEIRGNKDIVLAFVSPPSSGKNISYATDKVKAVLGVMKAALLSDPLALEYALPEQKKDESLVWTALFGGGVPFGTMAYEYADDTVLKDIKFFKKIIKKLTDDRAAVAAELDITDISVLGSYEIDMITRIHNEALEHK